MIKILLAEDDYDFGSLLKQYLELHNFETKWAKDGEEALALFQSEKPDACILDVMMPKMDGFVLAEKIVDLSPETPFIFLTARQQKEDKLKGLKLGANDYIVKPFDADVLVLKLQNLLKWKSSNKHQSASTITNVNVGNYFFDTIRNQLISDEIIHQLTEKESHLLKYLIDHKNVLIPRSKILKALWEKEDYFTGRSMDVFISRLRKYFKNDPSITITAIRGVGLELKIK